MVSKLYQPYMDIIHVYILPVSVLRVSVLRLNCRLLTSTIITPAPTMASAIVTVTVPAAIVIVGRTCIPVLLIVSMVGRAVY